MKIIVLCATLAAFCACAYAQVANPLNINGAHTHVGSSLVHDGETWFFGGPEVHAPALLRTDSRTRAVVPAGLPHANIGPMQPRLLLGALGCVLYEFHSSKSGLYELWRADGTPAGDVLVASHPAQVESALEWNGHVYFLVDGVGLRRTRGIELDAQDVFAFSGQASGLCALSNGLVFQVQHFNPQGMSVYFSNGNPGHATECFHGASDTGAGVLGAFLNEAYFLVQSAPGALAASCRLYKTDGTPSGTVVLSMTLPPLDGFLLTTIFNDVLYFQVRPFVQPDQLWRTNGTAGGTRRLHGGTGSTSFSGRPVAYDGALFFPVTGIAAGLWKLTATEELVELHRSGGPGPIFQSLLEWQGRLLLSGPDIDSPGSLWTFDGGHGVFRPIRVNIEFKGAPGNEYHFTVGRSGSNLVIADVDWRLWLLDTDEPRQRSFGQGCAASPAPGWPALACVLALAAWRVRRHFGPGPGRLR